MIKDYKLAPDGGAFGVKYVGVWLGCGHFKLGQMTENELETMYLAAKYNSLGSH